MNVLSGVAAILGIILLWGLILWYNPVKRDRLLFVRSGWWFILYALTCIVCILMLIWCIAEMCNVTENQIYVGPSGQDNGSDTTFWNILCQFVDPGNIHESESKGHWIALMSALAGVVCLSGLLVSTLVNMISHRTQKWKQGLVRYDFRFNRYVVIIGINEQTASIVRQSLKRKRVKFVLIQTRKDVEKARLDLELKMDDDLEDRIVFYSGERTSAEDIAKLRLEKAVEVYILGEDMNHENEKDHDSFNVNCLEHISSYIKDYKHRKPNWNKRVRVHVDFEYQSTFTAFKATHLYQKLDADIEFVPFNVHEIWAKKIFIDNFAVIPAGKKGEVRVQRYNPIDTYKDEQTGKRLGITKDCRKNVHLIILGMNQMGTALATQAALLCHFPNFSAQGGRRTTITFIDDHAKEEADYYIGRFSSLFELSRHRIVMKDTTTKLGSLVNDKRVCYSLDAPFYDPMAQTDGDGNHIYSHLLGDGDRPGESFLDIDWEFIQGNVASMEIQDYITGIAKDPEKTTTVAICFNNSQQSIASAMYLPEIIYKKVNQVLVYQQNCFDLVDDIANGDMEWKRYPNLYPFGMIEGSYTENQFEHHLAKLVGQRYQGKLTGDETLLMKIDKTWDQMGIVEKLANIDVADSIPIKYRSMGMSNPHVYASIPDDIDDMVCSEHLRWTTERLMMGFRCLTKAEQEPFEDPTVDRSRQKRIKKGYISEFRAHLDICSGARLKVVDPVVYEADHDRKLIVDMPEMLKLAEWVSILRLADPRYKNSQHVGSLRNFFTDRKGRPAFRFIKGEGGTQKLPDKTNHSFWMAEFPVTQRQWELIMGVKQTVSRGNRKAFLHDEMPVVNVSKQDVDDFLDILRKRTGLYFSLPSRKEWLYAATLTDTDAYEKYVSTKDSVRTSPVRVTAMADLQQSATGLKHILGNVWEWTNEENEHHSFEFCGGSWRFAELETDLKDDYWHQSWGKEMKSDDLGFRLVWKFDQPGFSERSIEDILSSPLSKVSKETLVKWWLKLDGDLSGGEGIGRMVRVRAGSYVMGANENQDPSADKNERPRHIVEIPCDYFVCDVPVTQHMWSLVMSEEKNPTRNRIGDNLPQTDVTWDDAQLFIQRLNQIWNNLSLELPSDVRGMVFRLPTEAEWEYAAKGGHLESDMFDAAGLEVPKKLDKDGNEIGCDHEVKDMRYHLYSGSDVAEDVAWFDESVIREVALKKPNKLGLYDMSGNIWEWCHDFYQWDIYDNGNVSYPIGKNDGTYVAHVFRGGSWKSTKWDCRCTRANFWIASHRSNDLGFRLVLGKPVDEVRTEEK